MRIPFAAGSIAGRSTKLILAPRGAPAPFPGPWRLAAVIRVSDQGVGAASAEACRSSASAR